MKKCIFICLAVLVMSLSIGGCNNANEETASENNDTVGSSIPTSAADDPASAASSKISADVVFSRDEMPGVIYSEIIENAAPIEVSSLSKEEIEEIINAAPNLYVSDYLYFNVPQTAILANYIASVPVGQVQSFETDYNHFLAMFEYLFPGHVLDDDYFFYFGGSSKLGYDEDGNFVDFKRVKDCYDDLMADKEGEVGLIYDETWVENPAEWSDFVCFETGCPIGYGYTIINKGKAEQISGKITKEGYDVDVYPSMESYDPAAYFERVASYSPQSTVSYKLLDKEVPINEAVEFFEQYINNLPYPQEANLTTRVVAVDVLRLNHDTYGYYFLTTEGFHDIPFDHIRSGTSHSSFDYDFSPGDAFMVESNDVDVLYGYYRLDIIHIPRICQTCISLEEAIGLISKNLTQYVDFEVQNIELIYSKRYIKTEQGYVDTAAGNPCIVAPAWKFTLFNANDSLTYVCYVDAEDGGNFRYYTTPQDMRILE